MTLKMENSLEQNPWNMKWNGGYAIQGVIREMVVSWVASHDVTSGRYCKDA